jgi:hypothetical protein
MSDGIIRLYSVISVSAAIFFIIFPVKPKNNSPVWFDNFFKNLMSYIFLVFVDEGNNAGGDFINGLVEFNFAGFVLINFCMNSL